MTISLINAIRNGGSSQAAGSVLTLDPSLEADIVARGDARFVWGADPSRPSRSALDRQADRGASIATKCVNGLMDVASHGADRNTHIQMTTEAHFDAVRVILFNAQATTQTGVKAAVGVAAAAGAHLATQSFTPDTWVDVTWATVSSVTQAAGAAARPSITVSDWMPIQSLERTDGGRFPLLHVRVYQPAANANITKFSPSGIETWMQTAERMHRVMVKDGSDMIATKGSFTAPATAPRWVPFAIQYMARGRVATLAVAGDSIAVGVGATNYFQSQYMRVCETLSEPSGPIELANFGWAGQTSVNYFNRTMDLLSNGVIGAGHVLVFHAFSPNDYTTAVTQAGVNASLSQTTQIVQKAIEKLARPVIVDAMPANPASKNWDATDSLRRDFNGRLAAYTRIPVVGMSAAVSGAVDADGQTNILSDSTSDNLHPNEVGIRRILGPTLQALAPELMAA